MTSSVHPHLFKVIRLSTRKLWIVVHVIKPLFPRVSALIKATYISHPEIPLLHTSWLTSIFQRCFQHESRHINIYAINEFLNLSLNQCPLLIQGNKEFIFNQLLDALNQNSIYFRYTENSYEYLPAVSTGIINFFTSCLEVAIDKALFFQELLHSLRNHSWSAVPLFYISYALCQLPSLPLWNNSSLMEMKELFLMFLKNNVVLIRGATQCFFLETTTNLFEINANNLNDWSLLLASVRIDECLNRNTVLWCKIVHSLSKAKDVLQTAPLIFINDLINNFLSESGIEENTTDIDTQPVLLNHQLVARIARTLLLFLDADILLLKDDTSNPFCLLLSEVNSIAKSINYRPYLLSFKADKAIQLVCSLWKEMGSAKVYSRTEEELLYFTLEIIEDLLIYIQRQLINVSQNIKDLEKIDLYIDLLKEFSQHSVLHDHFHKFLNKFVPDCCHYIWESHIEDFSLHYVQIFTVWKILSWTCKDFTSLAFRFKSDILKSLQKVSLEEEILLVKSADYFLKGEDIWKNNWGKLISNYIENVWTCIQIIFCYEDIMSENLFSAENYLKQGLFCINIGSKEAMLAILKTFQKFISMFISTNQSLICEVLNSCWKHVTDIGKDFYFIQLTEEFVKLAFQPCLLSLPSDTLVFDLLSKFSQEIYTLGETRASIYKSLIMQCCTYWIASKDLTSARNYITLLIDAATFGPVHRKDLSIIHDTMEFIESLEEKCAINQLKIGDHDDSKAVRIFVVTFITCLNTENQSHKEFCWNVLENLLIRDAEIIRNKSRYFGNSFIHRQKHRIWQLILILEPFIDAIHHSELLNKLLVVLSLDAIQPSVRLMIEWISIRIVYKNPLLSSDIISQIDKAGEKRVGSLNSLFAIIIHVGQIIPVSFKEEFLNDAFLKVLPWCMVQHFTTRLFAQLCLHKLWKICEKFNLVKLMDKNSIIKCCLNLYLENNNATRNLGKLLEDFYFTVFDPLEHYDIETIFYILPKLTNMTPQEWILPKVFIKYNRKYWLPSPNTHPLHSSNSLLRKCGPAVWISKYKEFCDTENSDEICNDIQKKITPWKSMMISQDDDMEIQLHQKKKHLEGSLIIVASLIDRIPNLGGLCRSCEIFGVSEFIVGSMHYLQDKQFQNLSVSAEKWIPVKEVKPHDLKLYLTSMKKNGYTVIGAEQTVNSIKLTDYKFPVKTLFLLGNEKEGIPVELINMLDICIEIPQQGLIRSLNVHVSGAVFIWEYTRQHLYSNNFD